MKRLPLILTVFAVVLLSASLAYWALQLFKPAQRPLAAAPQALAVPLNLDAAKGLFGGQITVAAASNYQLKGVVAAHGSDSAAIISVDGQPAMAYGQGREIAPGVTIKEVQAKYVVLSEGGALKRIELASDAAASTTPAPSPLQAAPMPQPPVPATPAPPAQPANSASTPAPIAPVPGFDRLQ
ncbi:type II secretion system protein N [Pseudoduganella danionis]|uniref:type II secretion system protein N n=1 Tax=Pseudoduganella danionis TaxID=1890295 RepID=UPI0035ADE11C